MQVQPIFIIHGFNICKFTYLLKFITPKSILTDFQDLSHKCGE